MKKRQAAFSPMRTDIQKAGQFPYLIDFYLVAELGLLRWRGRLFTVLTGFLGRRHGFGFDLAEVRVLAGLEPAAAIAAAAGLIHAGCLAQDELGKPPRQV